MLFLNIQRILDENHKGQASKDPLHISDRPITRSKAKKIMKTMQGHAS